MSRPLSHTPGRLAGDQENAHKRPWQSRSQAEERLLQLITENKTDQEVADELGVPLLVARREMQREISKLDERAD